MQTDHTALNLRLPADWQAPLDIQNRLGAQVGRQRAIVDESVSDEKKSPLLLVLHEIPERGEPRRGIFYWRNLTHQWFVYRQGQPYEAREDGLAALNDHLQRYEAVQQQLREDYEEARRAHHYLALLEEVALQSHAADNLYRTLEMARTFMREKQIDYDVEIINTRDRAYNLKREFDLLYLDTQNALDYREAHASEILNLLILIFFPLTLVASLIQTGITERMPTLLPTVDPLLIQIGLLAAAFLLGIGLYLFISPTRKRQRRAVRPASHPSLRTGTELALGPNRRAKINSAGKRYRHPLDRWRLRRKTITLDKEMAHYAVDTDEAARGKRKR